MGIIDNAVNRVIDGQIISGTTERFVGRVLGLGRKVTAGRHSVL